MVRSTTSSWLVCTTVENSALASPGTSLGLMVTRVRAGTVIACVIGSASRGQVLQRGGRARRAGIEQRDLGVEERAGRALGEITRVGRHRRCRRRGHQEGRSTASADWSSGTRRSTPAPRSCRRRSSIVASRMRAPVPEASSRPVRSSDTPALPQEGAARTGAEDLAGRVDGFRGPTPRSHRSQHSRRSARPKHRHTPFAETPGVDYGVADNLAGVVDASRVRVDESWRWIEHGSLLRSTSASLDDRRLSEVLGRDRPRKADHYTGVVDRPGFRAKEHVGMVRKKCRRRRTRRPGRRTRGTGIELTAANRQSRGIDRERE